MLAQLSALPQEEWWLKRGLGSFLFLTLAILGAAFWALGNIPTLTGSAWVLRAIIAASLVQAMGTGFMVAEAGGWISQDCERVLTGMGTSVGLLGIWVVCGFWMAIARDGGTPHVNPK